MLGKGLTVREIATRREVGKTALYEALKPALAVRTSQVAVGDTTVGSGPR